VSFNTDPYARVNIEGDPTYNYDRREINYETLAREPVLEEIGTGVFELSSNVTWEWGYRGLPSFGQSKEWVRGLSSPVTVTPTP